MMYLSVFLLIHGLVRDAQRAEDECLWGTELTH